MIGLLRLHGVSTFGGTIEQYTEQSISHSIDTVVVRALKYDEIRKHIPALLTSVGKVILYRTSAIEKQEIGEEFHLLSETAFFLRRDLATIVTVIEKNN